MSKMKKKLLGEFLFFVSKYLANVYHFKIQLKKKKIKENKKL